ncbi:amino acid adenylation domain-containing protein [uncultured Nostoc sp.]|uniref:non-ribosomal peptide synthetase n=1 Tax=uncultured Nostoc sp. TaxID=340711 RepID=UPI0035CC854B
MNNNQTKSMKKTKNIESIYPLTPMQQGMLFHSLFAPESGVYFGQMILNLKENVNVAAFESAWRRVVDRYSIFRTLFIWENRQTPLQVVLKQVKLPWNNLDWRELSPTEQQQQLSELLQIQRRLGFEFNQAPLMRCTLVRLGEDTYKFIWSHHHILTDGWCLPIIFKAVLSFYEAEVRGETSDLPTPRSYCDYITWLNSQDQEAALEFWRQTLQGFSTPTPFRVNQLKFQFQHQKQGWNYKELEIRLSAQVSRQLQDVAQQHHVTLSTIVQAAWALLLSLYSGENDVVFGVTVSGRPGSLSGVEEMVGLFINTLPLRVQISPQQQLISWLQQIQQLMLELQDYSYTSLVDIQVRSEVPKGIPLFESIVVFENYPVDSSLSNEGSLLQLDETENFESTNYPLTVIVGPGDELLIKIAYDSVCFEEDTIRRMLGHLQTIFSAIVENPKLRMGELPLLSEAERHQLLVEWNDTECEYPRDKCIHQLFEEQVNRTPNATAVVFDTEQLTYLQLNQKANQLAHYLQSLGVRPEVLVGICMERSIEMVVGLLGILKAGGAYLPLDPTYPAERLSLMLSDSQVSMVLTQEKLVNRLTEYQGYTVCLDPRLEVISQKSDKNPISEVKPDNLAYVIYTSGSTGKPKGVLVPHKGLLNLVFWHQRAFEITPSDRATQLAGTAFDASVWELWPYLTAGASIYLVKPELLNSFLHLRDWLVSQEITITFVPTPVAERLLLLEWSQNSALRILLTGGDQLHLYPSASIPFKVINNYGPTENTVVTTSTHIVFNEKNYTSPPIGYPIANTQTYVLNSYLQPVPIGSLGELYIGGASLARSYLNRPDLTAEKFIPNPFSQSEGARLYKTGDLARYLPNGNIEYLGRIDNQVKIRGFRIELGEIEAVLSQYPTVRQVAVITREDEPGNKSLVAYIVLSQDEKPNVGNLRAYLLSKLPNYMVPQAFVILETLPLTPNGKIDRRTLPAPDIENDFTLDFVAPRTPTEEVIANIFAEVLGLKLVGINGNFFEMGGHSLLATQVISRLREAFSIDLPLRSLFDSPTVAGLAEQIEKIRFYLQHLQDIANITLNNREEIEL